MAESEPKPRLIELVGPGAGNGWKVVLKSGKSAVVHEIPVPAAEAAAAVPRIQRLADHRHPALSPVLAWGSDPNGIWVAVEPNEGTPLTTILTRGPLTPPAAAALGTAVLSGVAALHEAGIAMGGFGATAIRVTGNGDVRLAGHPAAAVRGAPSQADLRADVRSCGMAVCAAFGVDPAGAPAPPNVPPGLVVTMRSMASGAMGPAADRAQGALREMASALLAPDRMTAAQSELALRAGGRETPGIAQFLPKEGAAASTPQAPAPAPYVPAVPREDTPPRAPVSYDAPPRSLQTYPAIPTPTYTAAPQAAPAPTPAAADPKPSAVPTWSEVPPRTPASSDAPAAAAAMTPAAPAPTAPAPLAPAPVVPAPAAPGPSTPGPGVHAPTPAVPAPAVPAQAAWAPAAPAPVSPGSAAPAPAVPAPNPWSPDPAAPVAGSSAPAATNPPAPRREVAAPSPPLTSSPFDTPGTADTPSTKPPTPAEPAAPIFVAVPYTPRPATPVAATPAPAVPAATPASDSPARPTWTAVESPAWTPASPAPSSGYSTSTAAGSALSAPARTPTVARRPAARAPIERPAWLIPAAIAAVLILLVGGGGVIVLRNLSASKGGTAAASPTTKTSPKSSPSTSPTSRGPLAVPTFGPAAAAPVTSLKFCSTATPCSVGSGSPAETGTACDLSSCHVEVAMYFSSPQSGTVSYTLKLFDRCTGQTTDLPGPSQTPKGFVIAIPADHWPVSIPSGLKSAALVAVSQQPAVAASAPLMLGGDTCS